MKCLACNVDLGDPTGPNREGPCPSCGATTRRSYPRTGPPRRHVGPTSSWRSRRRLLARNAARPGGDLLRIQVVHAAVDPNVWRSLSRSGNVNMRQSYEEASETLARAIEKKVAQIPRRQRPSLVLALDASLLPGLALDPVLVSFRERHRDLLASAGFRSVWIVGPAESLTQRLDLD